jgi:glucan phosphorylase
VTNRPDGKSQELDARIVGALRHRVGKNERAAKPHDWYNAAVLALRDDIIDNWFASTSRAHEAGAKRVYYLSLEFLIGRLLRDALSNLGVTREMEQALREHGLDLAVLEELEPDAALGNGGLGRLAACFMESMASRSTSRPSAMASATIHGLFRQRIDDGWQVEELPETGSSHGNPWEFERRESSYLDRFRRGGDAERWRHGQAATGPRAKRSKRQRSTRRWWAGAASGSTRCGCGPRGRRRPDPARCLQPRRPSRARSPTAGARRSLISGALSGR